MKTKLIIFSIFTILIINCKKEIYGTGNEELSFENVNESYIVVATSLILREKPDKKSKALDSIPFQAKIDITKKSKEVSLDSRYASWGKTTYKNKDGFVFLGFTRQNVPLKSLRISRSSNEQFEVNELIPTNANQEYCGDWFSGFCTTQIKNTKNNKIIFEKPYYGFEEFSDDNNVVISYGGSENCQTSFEYIQINLLNLKETNFYKYSSDTCTNKSSDDEIIHNVCIINDCYIITEIKRSISIKNTKNKILKTLEKADSFKVNYKEWKNPEMSIDGNILKFSEVLSN